MLSRRQRDLIAKQRADELGELDPIVEPKIKVRVGDYIEFLDHPEYSGPVKKISKDQWKLITIDNGTDNPYILNPIQLEDGLRSGRMVYRRKKDDKQKDPRSGNSKE